MYERGKKKTKKKKKRKRFVRGRWVNIYGEKRRRSV